MTASRRRRSGRRVAAVLSAVLAVAACSQSDASTGDTPGSSTGAPLAAVGGDCSAGDPQGRTAVAALPGVPHGPEPSEPLLVDQASQPAAQARATPGEAVAAIAARPLAFPVGEWLTDVRGAVAARAAAARSQGATAIFMIYAIPHRDAGAGFSAGGAPDAGAYRAFTAQVVAGIGDARAVVVLEPDSLGQLDVLSAEGQNERIQLLNEAVDAYGTLPGTSVYLDGTNCGWTPAPAMADRLLAAGVARTRGFAVNVANYYPTEDEVARAEIISALTGGAHYVVDTSRNGQGRFDGQLADPWCNPPGRGLGVEPTTDTGSPRADAYLWVKTPGASDGDCGRGNPEAGQWWPRQAEDLYQHAAP